MDSAVPRHSLRFAEADFEHESVAPFSASRRTARPPMAGASSPMIWSDSVRTCRASVRELSARASECLPGRALYHS
jgi:hypothetical protein